MSQASPSLLHGVYPEQLQSAIPRSPVAAWIERAIDRLGRKAESAALGRNVERDSDPAWHSVLSSWEKVLGRCPEAPVLHAAKLMCRDRFSVELACAQSRQQALSLAALKMAVDRIPVHLVFAAEPAQEWPELEAVASDLGVRLGRVEQGDSLEQRREAHRQDIVAISYRQLVFDYLLDRQKLSGKRGRLKGRLQEALAVESDKPVMRGLSCALLVDTVAVLIDGASQPIAISGAAPAPGHSQAVYAEAIACAGALIDAGDYTAGFELTARGEEHLDQLTQALGPLWRGPARARSLVQAALQVLSMEEGADYVLAGEQLRLSPGITLQPGFVEQDYRQFILARHGLAGEAPSQGVIQRLCVQHFFTRYCHLSGVCSDDTLHRRELRSVYGLFTLHVPGDGDAAPVRYFVYRDSRARCAALGRRIAGLQEQGMTALLLWPDEEARSRDLSLSTANGPGLSAVDYLLASQLEDLDDELLSQQSSQLIAASSPTSMEIDCAIRGTVAPEQGFEVFASSDETLFTSVARWRRFMLPYSNAIYRRVRDRQLDPERRHRRQVAEQDAYIRQTLAFSGDNN